MEITELEMFCILAITFGLGILAGMTWLMILIQTRLDHEIRYKD